ncbi:MAG: CxxC motif-containing protein (DUF1111 family) [Myxococcota bacterium]|jgi:CxxC motif-containing protein (DUF1111 family)
MRVESSLWLCLFVACSSASLETDATLDPDVPSDTGLPPDTEALPDIVPLYNPTTVLQPQWIEDRGDAVVTRFSDRGRDRHAREDQFQSYDHYLPEYWHFRTARFRFVDYVAHGGDAIEVSMVTEWQLSIAEFRAWYLGLGTVATYSGNYAPGFDQEGPGTFDDDHELIDYAGTQYKYAITVNSGFDFGVTVPLEVGQYMEFEASQFLAGAPGSRQNYYGTTALYAVGVGGLVPWQASGSFEDPSSDRERSEPIDPAGWVGGRTTLPYQYSDEPDNHFMQMATNLAPQHGQPFVLGRRVHHSDMVDGTHDESAANGVFVDVRGLAGPNYVHGSCDGCHTRNGRAAVAPVGEPLDKWVFRIGSADGGPDPLRGSVLQPESTQGSGEGTVAIASWQDVDGGLRSPNYTFESGTPERFSARIAPQLVGMGLLEAIDEADVLAWEDPNDDDDDGVSGRAQRIEDPTNGEWRLGRFGWKAGAASVSHQVASALNADMGVMTHLMPEPDCGPEQLGCGNAEGAELADSHFQHLSQYVALLGVRARRDLGDAEVLRGEDMFAAIGCVDCHRASFVTSSFHPFGELREQSIQPYTDLLLHDMGDGLADNLGEGRASGAEWRTAPLWSLGLGACVTGGVTGPNQNQSCTPQESFLHDGRARTVEEAIAWHGGEGQTSRDAFAALLPADQQAIVTFLRSL